MKVGNRVLKPKCEKSETSAQTFIRYTCDMDLSIT